MCSKQLLLYDILADSIDLFVLTWIYRSTKGPREMTKPLMSGMYYGARFDNFEPMDVFNKRIDKIKDGDINKNKRGKKLCK